MYYVIDPSPDGTITIVHSDRELITASDRGGVRRRAWSRLARRLLRRKITPCYETLYTGGDPGPPEVSDVWGVNNM